MKCNLFSGVVLTVVTLAVGGCSVAKKVEEAIGKVDAKIERDDGTLPKDPNRGGVRESDKAILGTKVIRPSLGMPLPNGLDTKRFGWEFDTYVTLPEVAAKIGEITRGAIQVKVNDRRQSVGGAAGQSSLVAGGGDTLVNPQNAAAAFQASMGGGAPAGGRGFRQVYLPSFEGTIPQFLQSLEPLFDTTATYRDGAIVLDAFQVVTCDVAAPPTANTITAEVTGATTGAATGPSGSTASQGSQSQAKLDTFAEVKAELGKLVGPNEVAEVSPTLRRFTVVGSSETARRARQYCDSLSDFLATRIAIEATIVEVTVSEGDDYGMDLEPVWKGAGVSLGLAGVAPQIANSAASGSIRVLPLAEGGKSQHWAGSQAFIKAASTDGRLANSRHHVAILQNGRAQTLNLTTRQDYIKNITNNPGNSNSIPSAGTQTDTINYGYSMQITAHATGADEIQVHGSITVSDLAGQVDKAAGNGQVVQLLTVPQRSFDIDVPLGNGETVVISGNEGTRVRRDRTGIINPAFFMLGGADKASLETTRLVLFLSAYRLKSPRAGQSSAR